MEKIIEIKNLSKTFKDNSILENVDFSVEKGDIVGLTGTNGCGKSVLLKIICGLIKAEQGEILVDGVKVEGGCFPQNIGVILDCAGFLPYATGFDNLWELARIRKRINKDDVTKVLDRVGLGSSRKIPVGKYSLGMKQRLAIAQAIMEHPSILVLDEPFNAIDENTKQEFEAMLRELNEEENVTIIMTSHHKDEIAALCTKVYQIKDKKINLIS
ncbi:MAG: ABC transporter ATP-binding protein [Lachnospiraceae bacterium]|nr:ABC transporter ATP-binding protein [Lachnospiraceae bacterium]